MNEFDGSRLQGGDLNIAFIPAGNEDTGSSRIRVYGLLPWLRKAGVSFAIGPDPKANVLYVQKRLTPEIVARVREARALGTCVLYDVDDLGAALSYWAPPDLFDEMLNLAHTVIADTPGRMRLLNSKYPNADIRILPPLVDYAPTAPQPVANLPENEIRVLWFGSMSNISLFHRYANILSTIAGVRIVVITNEAYLSADGRTPNAEFILWERHSFPKALRSCHLSCLMHDGNEADRTKNNNRMITSITWGVPALVSNTPEYSHTANACGVPQAIFSEPEDLGIKIDALRSSRGRQAYLDTAQPTIWKEHAPEFISWRFIELINQIRARMK